MDPAQLAELEQRLERGDLELRFHDGRTTKAHCLLLSLASNVLQNLMDDVAVGDQPACKRKRTDSAPVSSSLKVSTCMGTRPPFHVEQREAASQQST
jgi:hypothetical protein